MFLQVAAASLSLLIQSQVPNTPVPAALARPTLAAPQGSAGLFALGFVQLQPSSPGVTQIGNSNITGVSRAGSFQGNGALLTALDAGSIASGTINDARLSSNVARLATAQVFSGQKTFSSAPIFSAAGAPFSVASSTLVTNLNCDLLDGLNSSAFLQSIPVPLVLNNPAFNGNAIMAKTNNGGNATAIWGEATDGVGVYGFSANGIGIQAFSNSGMGIYAEAYTGVAVHAANYNVGGAVIAEATAGVACAAISWGSSSPGVLGANYDATSGGPGVRGESVLGSGVVGAGGLNGVQGSTANPYTSGVYGENTSAGYGIAGRSTGYGIGAYGEAAYPGWGIFCAGDLRVTNDMYVSGAKTGYVADIVRNVGNEPLEIGTLVEIVGASAPLLGRIPVIDVRKASSQHGRAALGPIAYALSVETWSTTLPPAADGTTPTAREAPRFNLHRQDGAIAPGAFGNVVTLGSFEALAVDASYGPVMPGDLLVASPNPGYAMVSNDPLPGTLIGKALGTLDFGTGQIPMIVMR